MDCIVFLLSLKGWNKPTQPNTTTMKKPFDFNTEETQIGHCHKCSKKLNEKKTIWLEYSITDDCMYYPKEFPHGHDSQGCFEFGPDCAKKVVTRNEKKNIDWDGLYKSTTKEQMFNMVWNYAMLMTDEQEEKAFEFIKEEKKP